MEITQVVDIFRDGIGVALRIALPLLLLSMAVGLIVAIFQAITQIHEQTLGFVLKLLVVILFFIIGGGWVMDTLTEYTVRLFQMI